MKQRSLSYTLSAVLLGSVLAAPLAFAQDATGTQSATPAQSTSGDASAQDATQATPATPATPATGAKKVTWADLDTDRNGSLSKTEAGALDSLSQVFDDADANKDGALSADEYRDYLKTHGNGDAGGSSADDTTDGTQ